MSDQNFDLLSTVQQGGCSAKLPPHLLDKVLKDIKLHQCKELLVGTGTHDDAAVWKVNEETAIIQTTDFFPPICGDAYEFGQIAAANAMSDVFAMGGKVILALNLVMFPRIIDLSVLKEILRGGADKVHEAGGFIGGGHTIEDYPPKYGLAVTGTVHPDAVITNSGARAGDILILTKPVGTGTIVAGHRLGEVPDDDYRTVIESMKTLNRIAAEAMQKFNVRSATDVTGFGLLGHALEMAESSNVTLCIDAAKVPLFNSAYDLVDMGCIPGAAFTNLKYVQEKTCFKEDLDYNLKMLMLDAQTSGGLLISVSQDKAEVLLMELKTRGCPHAAIIGRVEPQDTEPFVKVGNLRTGLDNR